MSHAFATRLTRLTSQLWLGPAMARQTTSEDTHPALSERLAAIGEEPSFSPRSQVKLLTDYWPFLGGDYQQP